MACTAPNFHKTHHHSIKVRVRLLERISSKQKKRIKQSKIKFTRLSKSWLSLHQFWWNSQFFSGVTRRSAAPFTICFLFSRAFPTYLIVGVEGYWCTSSHTIKNTLVMIPLDKWSARRRSLPLPNNTTNTRQTPAPIERPQTCALDRAATGTGRFSYCLI